jgi:trigger factor
MTPTSKKSSGAADNDQDIRVETEETTPVVRTIRVVVPEKRVRRAFDDAYRQLSKSANVRGFRRGKVPRSVLEKLYGASIPEEIERVVVQETMQAAIEKSEVLPVVQPEVESGRPEPGNDFEYSLRVEVKPEIELPDLEGLPATQPPVELGPTAVEEELEKFRQNASKWIEEPDGTSVANGHTITFDYEGSVDGELFEGGKAEGADLEIGKGRMIPGFEEGLIGAQAGDSVTLKVTFPEDYQAEHLAGKDAEFACTVHTIRGEQIPELDDEFAKDMGDYESLDDYREKIANDLRAELEREAEAALQKSVMDSLLERTDFEVPPGIVERQLMNQIESMQQQFQGQIPPDILQQQLARMRDEGRESAERRVRESWALEAVVKSKAFEVDADEVETRFIEMAERQGMPVEQLKKMASEQGWSDAVEAELLDKKALAFLASKATVEERVAGDSE